MSGTLNTLGKDVKGKLSYFDAFSVIRYSASNPLSQVFLTLEDGGILNLADELGKAGARIGATKPVILTTGAGHDILSGSAGNDTIYGGSGNDRLIGNGGNNKLYGGDGNDVFEVSRSSTGIDAFWGGEGKDSLHILDDVRLSRIRLDDGVGSHSVESIVCESGELSGTAGADLFQLGSVEAYRHYTKGGVAKITVNMREGDDQFFGSKTGDYVFGGKGNDKLYGMSGNDTLNGEAGTDVVSGGEGNDIISGGASRDTLTGGAGSDVFLFDVKPTSADVDTITDFEVGSDKVRFSHDIFSALSSDTSLKEHEFGIGSRAENEKQRIIYEESTGRLFYDDDGSGMHAQVQIALLTAHLGLKYNNFDVTS